MNKHILSLLVLFTLMLTPHMSMAMSEAKVVKEKSALATVQNLEPEETFGTQALGVALDGMKLATTHATNFINNFAALPNISSWFAKQYENPTYAKRWVDIGQKALITIGFGYLIAWTLKLFLLPLRRRINKIKFKSPWDRFGWTVWWFFVLLLPVIAFLGASMYALDYLEPTKLASFVVMTVVYALSMLQLIRITLKFFLAGKHPNLRFVPLSTENALYIRRWIMWLSFTGFIGYFLADIAGAVKVPSDIISGFTNLVALSVIFMAIIAIMKKRSFVATAIRGNLSAARRANTLLDNSRLWLARSWHVFAIAYLIVGYFMTMLGSEGGLLFMIKGTVGTIVTVLAMRLGFYFDAKFSAKKKADEKGSAVYRLFLKYTFGAIICVAGLLGLVTSWGGDIAALFASPWGQRILGSTFSIVTTLLIVVAIYEIINRTIEGHLNKVDENGAPVQANTRARTLLPMMRKAIMIILGVIVTLVVLAELGVNIAPLLAGAGVLGVAIGFGSQTLVKDFLTGLFIILEDSIAVGDIVHLGSSSGVVEEMSLRTIRLRNTHGSVHIIPFSDISTIINDSKEFSYAVIDAGVAYDSDLSKVMDVMTTVCENMRNLPEFKDDILEDFQIMGVQSLGDSAITVRGRMKTNPGKHYGIRRQYNMFMKIAFDDAGIEIPFPVVTHINKADTATAQPALTKEKVIEAEKGEE